MTGTVRHRHSPRRSDMSSVRPNLRGDLTVTWLIFSERNRTNHALRAAASTSSAWPSTLTLRQIFAIRPSAPIRTVVRRIPWKVLAYMDFSPPGTVGLQHLVLFVRNNRHGKLVLVAKGFLRP